MVPQMV